MSEHETGLNLPHCSHYRDGEPLLTDDVQEWAIGKRWKADDARDLGLVAETVNHAMNILGH